MIHTNFYTGEMITPQQEQYTTEAEAVQNAGFGQYAVQQQAYIPPMYGLGGNAYQRVYGNGFGPPQQQYYQNTFMQAPMAPQQSWGNPVFQQGLVQPLQQQQEQYSQVYVPPVNLAGNDYLLPSNIEEIATDMVMRYYNEEAEYQGRRIAEEAKRRRSGYYNNPYFYNQQNYYGAPMYGPVNNNFRSSIFDEIENIKHEAKEKRVNLSKQLSRLAHNYLNDGITNEEIDEMYNGKFINVENTVYQWSEMDAMQARFTSERFVPIDPGKTPYREFVDKTRKQIESILPKDTPIEEFGSRINILLSEWELEELKERRRGFSDSYNSSTYKRLLRDRIAEKEANKSGFSLFESDTEPEIITRIDQAVQDLQATKNENLSAEERTKAAKSVAEFFGLNTFSEAVYYDEEGNLCLAANVGNHKGEQYVVTNENEAAYVNRRAKFLGFEDSIPKSDRYPEEKESQYNGFTESEFMFNSTHPPHSPGGG